MQFDWSYFFSLFSLPDFWKACVTVIELSTLTWLIGMVLGFFLACAKLSGSRWLRAPTALYIWFFRSVPLLVLVVSSTTCRSSSRPAACCCPTRSSPACWPWC